MHKPRKGGDTDANKNVVDATLLKAHGRWHSKAVEAYLQAGIDVRLEVIQQAKPSNLTVL